MPSARTATSRKGLLGGTTRHSSIAFRLVISEHPVRSTSNLRKEALPNFEFPMRFVHHAHAWMEVESCSVWWYPINMVVALNRESPKALLFKNAVLGILALRVGVTELNTLKISTRVGVTELNPLKISTMRGCSARGHG